MSVPAGATRRPRLAVIGGGIAGLAAAWYAAAAGAEVVVVEAAAAVGGKLRTAPLAGVAVDVGAEAMLARRPEGVELAEAVGLAPIAPVTTAARLRAGGELHPLPARTVLGVPGDLEALRASGVVSPGGLAKVATEPDLPPLAPLTDDVAVGALVRARLGNEVTDRLVEPLLGGVYAGRADRLSLQATMPGLAARLRDGGSLVAAARETTAPPPGTDPSSPVPARPVFASVAGGLAALPAALAESGRFAVHTGVTVRTVRRSAEGFVLECGAVPASFELAADAVVVAVPAAKAARLLRDLAPAAVPELAAIESASMAVVSLALPAGAALPPGSGLLVGAHEGFAVKGVTVSSHKWPAEVVGGDGLIRLRASVGRFGDEVVLQRDDAELVALVRHELVRLLGVEVEPVDAVVTRWGGGLPQYDVGHLERVRRIRTAVSAVPGLAACGAWLDGVGVPACIATGRAAASAALGPSVGAAAAAG